MESLENLALDDDGINTSKHTINFCSTCLTHLNNKRVPRLSLRNGLEIGRVPKALTDLSWVEQRLISIFNVHIHMLHFRNQDVPGAKLSLDQKQNQPHFKGTAFCVPQDTVSIHKLLPPPASELPKIIQV